jgi:ribosomal protein S1
MQGSGGLVTPGRKKGSRNQDLKRIRGAAHRGEVLIGSVKSVQSYGAFIALGSIDGLVHISEVADHWVGDLTKILRPGMAVRVIVLQVDGDGKQISLSIRKVPQADALPAGR